jgi:hypothetical protein
LQRNDVGYRVLLSGFVQGAVGITGGKRVAENDKLAEVCVARGRLEFIDLRVALDQKRQRSKKEKYLFHGFEVLRLEIVC